MKETQDFVCYSPPLFMYLLGKGIQGFSTGVHKETHKHYTVFKSSPELSQALTEWSEIRKHIINK
jgi:hypothetical protein